MKLLQNFDNLFLMDFKGIGSSSVQRPTRGQRVRRPDILISMFGVLFGNNEFSQSLYAQMK